MVDRNGRLVERLDYSPFGKSFHHLAGDVNGDGLTNFFDVQRMLALTAGGATPRLGDPAYESDADLNRDGVINFMGDILPMQADIGKAADGLSLSVPEGGPGNPVGYAAYWHINDFGPHWYARHRIYDPIAGRWLTRDPAGYVDGLSLYLYVHGNPFGLVDPLGLMGDDDGGLFQMFWQWVNGGRDELPEEADVYDPTDERYFERYDSVRQGQQQGLKSATKVAEAAIVTFGAVTTAGVPGPEDLVIGAAAVGLKVSRVGRVLQYADDAAGARRTADAVKFLEAGAEAAGRSDILKAADDAWEMAASPRGTELEDVLGQVLPDTYTQTVHPFKTVDFWDESTGHMRSVVSIDTTERAYSKAKGNAFLTRVKGKVDDAAEFKGHTMGGVDISAKDIQRRTVDVIIPEGQVSENIQRQMDEAAQYGQEQGVEVLFHQMGNRECPN